MIIVTPKDERPGSISNLHLLLSLYVYLDLSDLLRCRPNPYLICEYGKWTGCIRFSYFQSLNSRKQGINFLEAMPNPNSMNYGCKSRCHFPPTFLGDSGGGSSPAPLHVTHRASPPRKAGYAAETVTRLVSTFSRLSNWLTLITWHELISRKGSNRCTTIDQWRIDIWGGDDRGTYFTLSHLESC